MAIRKSKTFPAPPAPEGFVYAIGESGAPELTPIEEVVEIPMLGMVPNERGDGSYMTPRDLSIMYAIYPERRPAKLVQVLAPGVRRSPAFPDDPPCRFAWVDFLDARGGRGSCVLRDAPDAASPWWDTLPGPERARLLAVFLDSIDGAT
jgi:hypothetical protein